jgi:DNA-binding NarL/FixJ family response regulator
VHFFPYTRRECQLPIHTHHPVLVHKKGLTNREIASELEVTPGTVKLHRKLMYRKFSVHHRQMAVTLAREPGLLSAS